MAYTLQQAQAMWGQSPALQSSFPDVQDLWKFLDPGAYNVGNGILDVSAPAQPVAPLIPGGPMPAGGWPTVMGGSGGVQYTPPPDTNPIVNAGLGGPTPPNAPAGGIPPIVPPLVPAPRPTPVVPPAVPPAVPPVAPAPGVPVVPPGATTTPPPIPRPAPTTPPPVTTTNGIDSRNFLGEGAQTLAAQVQLAGPSYQAYNQYAPLYAQTDLNTLHNTLFGQFDSGWFEASHPGFEASFQQQQAAGQLQGWTPQQYAAAYSGLAANDPSLNQYYSGGINSINQFLTQQANQQTTAANTALRTANVQDAGALGGTALGYLQTLNPNQYQALNQAQAFAGANGGQGIAANTYQQQLGTMFGSGPQYNSVTSGNQITPDIVSAGAIGSYPTATATNNPLLGFAGEQAAGQGNGPLGNDLQNFARQQLSLGSGLSAQQANDASQAAREAWGARGLAMSPGAVGAEILNRDQYGQQLLQQREGFASGVNQLGQSQQGINNQYMLGVLGAGSNQGAQNLQASLANQQAGLSAQQSNLGAWQQASAENQQARFNAQNANAGFNQQAQLANQQAGLQAQQQNFGLGTNLAGIDYSRQQQNYGNILQNANLQSANAFNPFQQITSAGSANQGTNSGLFGQGASGSSGALGNSSVQNQFNPFNAYSSDLYNTNYNAKAAGNNAIQNNNGAQTGAIIGGVAKVAAAKFAVMCIPEGECVDTPNGPTAIENLHAGDTVTGYFGDNVTVLMKHEYKENPEPNRFHRFTLDDGAQLAVCDKHRIHESRAEDWTVGDVLSRGRSITNVTKFNGVTRSYDLLTEDLGYQMSGVPVRSMIEELQYEANKLAEAM